MNFLIDQRVFARALTAAANVAPRKSTRPALTHIKIEAALAPAPYWTPTVTITATDNELVYQTSLAADVQEQGAILVSASDVRDIVKAMPDDHPVECDLAEASSTVWLRSGGPEPEDGVIEFELSTLSSDEYPIIEGEAKGTFNYKADLLHNLLSKTLFASSTNEGRPYLQGVYIERKEGAMLKAVATDGHRLGLCEALGPDGLLIGGVIMPRKFCLELRKMIEPRQGEVEIGFDSKRVFVKYEGQSLISLLVEGSFPDYRQVIPKSPSIKCVVNRADLLAALRRVSLLSPEKGGGVRFTLAQPEQMSLDSGSGGTLTIASQSLGRGQAKQQLTCKHVEGELAAGFNAGYFAEALQSFDTEYVAIDFTNHLSPCIVRPHYEGACEYKSHLNVVMPMRL
jgi:DNA polymerase III subunit beta